ncbi:hypothetical protein ACJX0J_020064, partial [Zea mays]
KTPSRIQLPFMDQIIFTIFLQFVLDFASYHQKEKNKTEPKEAKLSPSLEAYYSKIHTSFLSHNPTLGITCALLHLTPNFSTTHGNLQIQKILGSQNSTALVYTIFAKKWLNLKSPTRHYLGFWTPN